MCSVGTERKWLHDWTRWSGPEAARVAGQEEVVSVKVQRRTCQRCNLMQVRSFTIQVEE